MDKKRLIIVALVILIVAVGVVWHKMSPSPITSVSPGKTDEQSQNAVSPTRKEAPKNIVVPEPNSTGQEADVAVPKSSVPAAPGVEAKLRTFEIIAANGKYNPSTVIVQVGDTVHINFKADDDVYDIVFPDYGLRQYAKKGETKIIEFSATIDGQFVFYCENSCPKGKMQGTLIVAPVQYE